MGCPICGAPAQTDAKFCGQCGARLPGGVVDDGLVGGRYRVGANIGEGLRKLVYLAHDTYLDRELAIAVVRPEGLDDVEVERLRREIQMLARVGSHPNVVTLYDVTQLDGATALLFEYLSGGTVADLLALAGTGLPVGDVRRIGVQVARALEAIHAEGIIFRDVKPANVLLTGDGSAKLCDFGLALRLGDQQLTDPRIVMGSLAYIAPERIAHRHYDQRSDLYSLGILLYEMLVGAPPFASDDVQEVGAQHLHAEPAPIGAHRDDVPPDLSGLVERLLAKDVGDRPQSAAEVAASLGRR